MFLIYSRVSTVEQAADNATSMAEQQRKGKAVATLRGAGQFDFALFDDPGVSGAIALAHRPAGSKMLEDAKKGDVIIAVKLDRLFRSTIDALGTAERLKKDGIDLILIDMGVEPVTGNGAAKFFFGILAMAAEFERDRINERTKDGRKLKAAKHGHLGGPPPFGFEVVGTGRESRLQPVAAEQASLTTIKQLMVEYTPASAAREAERLGIRCRSGKPFQIGQLMRIAEREIHVG